MGWGWGEGDNHLRGLPSVDMAECGGRGWSFSPWDQGKELRVGRVPCEVILSSLKLPGTGSCLGMASGAGCPSLAPAWPSPCTCPKQLPEIYLRFLSFHYRHCPPREGPASPGLRLVPCSHQIAQDWGQSWSPFVLDSEFLLV